MCLPALGAGTDVPPTASPKFPKGFFSPERVAQGKALSQTVCASCHPWPSPEILDRETWLNGALPWMMMVSGLSPEALPAGIEGELIRKSGSILTTPAVSKDEFGKIIAYYVESAPKSLTRPERPYVPATLRQFRARPLEVKSSEPMASLVQINPTNSAIFVGDGQAARLERLKADHTDRLRLSVGSVPVSLIESEEGLLVTCAGSFGPSEQAKGSITWVPRVGPATNLLTSLHRPVHTVAADLNGDGRRDLLVSMFGWYSGRLAWFENRGDGRYEEHVLFAKAGALRTEVRDLDGDGACDIVALIAQASETMLCFYNNGRGSFTEKTLFQRHASFGHTYFESADFNNDGKLDLLVCNGDNGDYASPVKPYHGVRIYLNAGEERFEERFFYFLPGATKALARDFDRDGDLDLACIAYYADYERAPREGFVYLENRGGLRFEASTFEESTAGRWLTMDAGDVDGDGDLDLVLGAALRGPGREAYIPKELSRKWRDSGTTLMLLENSGAALNP